MAEHGDGYHGAKGMDAFSPQSISSDTTTNGVILDLKGYEEVTFYIAAGTITAGTITPVLEEGAESDLSDASNVADKDLIGTEALATFAATDDDKVKALGYKGSKRYVRLKLTTADSANLLVGAVAVLGKPRHGPVSYS